MMSTEDFQDDPDAGVEPLDGEDAEAGVEPLPARPEEDADWEEGAYDEGEEQDQ